MKLRELMPLFLVSIAMLPVVAVERAETTFATPPWNHCLGLHKVRQFHLDLFSGYRERFDDPQGLFCTKLVCEDDTSTSRDDDELTVFGLNSGAHTLIYNKSLTSIDIIGGYGTNLMQFRRPRAVTGDRWGNLYVADTGNNRIQHLRYEDDRLRPVGAFGETELEEPSGICISGGLLFVSDTGHDRIVVFDTLGAFRGAFRPVSGTCALQGPVAIAAVSEPDGWLYYRGSFVTVIDSMGGRLWKTDHSGRVERIVRAPVAAGESRFAHIAVDYYGNIYVTDDRRNVVHKYTRHLDYIIAIGSEGGITLDQPRGITIYRRFGQIFVSERSGAQYFWIGTDVLRFDASDLAFDEIAELCRVRISFLLTEHSFVTVELENEEGEPVCTLVSDLLLPPGTIHRRIEAPCTGAESLAKCKLRVVVTARPTYSSRGFLAVSRESRLLEPTAITARSSRR